MRARIAQSEQPAEAHNGHAANAKHQPLEPRYATIVDRHTLLARIVDDGELLHRGGLGVGLAVVGGHEAADGVDRIHADHHGFMVEAAFFHRGPFARDHGIGISHHVGAHAAAHRIGQADGGMPDIDRRVGFHNDDGARFLEMLPRHHGEEAQDHRIDRSRHRDDDAADFVVPDEIAVLEAPMHPALPETDKRDGNRQHNDEQNGGGNPIEKIHKALWHKRE